jgi:peptidoglycan/LPS O-acetylase OafA/YrhL
VRNKRLDVLRCVAVLLVLARHAHATTFVNQAGWVGVDLFFVLSGFLISGLLFAEYKKRGAIDFKRFFIRRGLKIYPMFYLLLLFTVFGQLGLHHLSSIGRYLAEIFYVQNYFPGLWVQTWSLAVEEHFYILLPVFLLLLVRVSSDGANPFRAIPIAFVVVAAACLAFRIRTMTSVPPAQLTWPISGWALTVTHERMDSLFFGVLLGYFYHFVPQRLQMFDSRRNAVLFAIVAAALVSTSIFFRQTGRFMLTIGFTALYLGFGIILMLSLHLKGLLGGMAARVTEKIGSAFAYVGMYSYSIYIWHVAISSWLPGFIRRASGFRIDLRHSDLFYYVASLAFGIFMSRLIEYPILRIRDRIFPSGPAPISAKS